MTNEINNNTNEITIHNEAKVVGTGKHVQGNAKPVLCIETGKVYSSILDAAEMTGLSYVYLGNCIRADKPCKGFTYCYLNKTLEHLEPVVDRLKTANALEEDAEKYRKILAEKEEYEKETNKMKENLNHVKKEINISNIRIEILREKLNREEEKYESLMSEKDKLEFDIEHRGPFTISF